MAVDPVTIGFGVAGLFGSLFGRKKSAPPPPTLTPEQREALRIQTDFTKWLLGTEQQEYQRYIQQRPSYEEAVKALAQSFGYEGGRFTSPIYRPEVRQMVEFAQQNEANIRRRLSAMGASPETIQSVIEANRQKAYERGLAVAGESELQRRSAALQALSSLLNTYRQSPVPAQAAGALTAATQGLSDTLLRQQMFEYQQRQDESNRLMQLAALVSQFWR